jgi:hypothetical protein
MYNTICRYVQSLIKWFPEPSSYGKQRRYIRSSGSADDGRVRKSCLIPPCSDYKYQLSAFRIRSYLFEFDCFTRHGTVRYHDRLPVDDRFENRPLNRRQFAQRAAQCRRRVRRIHTIRHRVLLKINNYQNKPVNLYLVHSPNDGIIGRRHRILPFQPSILEIYPEEVVRQRVPGGGMA